MTETTTPSVTAPAVAPVAPIAYTRKQAAAALGISPRKLDQLVANVDSGLPIVRLGTKVLFPVNRLTTWFTDRIGKKV